MSKNKKKQNKGERCNWGESCTQVQEDTGARGHRKQLSPVTPIFYVQKQIEAKQGRKAQLGRVMHQRARGHEAEPKNSHFLCPKTKKKNEGERRNWREHARRCKRTRGRAQSLPFFILNNREKLQSENTGALYATL